MLTLALPEPMFDLRNAFDATVPDAFATVESQMLTTEQAAEYLNRKPSWVRQVLRHKIYVHKFGQAVRYDRRDLDAYIASCRQDPT